MVDSAQSPTLCCLIRRGTHGRRQVWAGDLPYPVLNGLAEACSRTQIGIQDLGLSGAASLDIMQSRHCQGRLSQSRTCQRGPPERQLRIRVKASRSLAVGSSYRDNISIANWYAWAWGSSRLPGCTVVELPAFLRCHLNTLSVVVSAPQPRIC